MKNVDVLGTTYKIEIKKFDEDSAFEKQNICGYCDSYKKEIVILDMMSKWPEDGEETCKISQKETLRHEIVHAFLNESGLKFSSCVVDGAWAKNEEMVDWFAIQGVKIYHAWNDSGAI